MDGDAATVLGERTPVCYSLAEGGGFRVKHVIFQFKVNTGSRIRLL